MWKRYNLGENIIWISNFTNRLKFLDPNLYHLQKSSFIWEKWMWKTENHFFIMGAGTILLFQSFFLSFTLLVDHLHYLISLNCCRCPLFYFFCYCWIQMTLVDEWWSVSFILMMMIYHKIFFVTTAYLIENIPYGIFFQRTCGNNSGKYGLSLTISLGVHNSLSCIISFSSLFCTCKYLNVRVGIRDHYLEAIMYF